MRNYTQTYQYILHGNKAYYIYDTSGNRVRKVVVKSNIKEDRFYVGDYEIYTKTNQQWYC